MTPIVLTSKVGPDGVLHLTLPLAAADQDVRVTVEPIVPKKQMTQEEWRAFLLSTADSIPDPTFERPPQGELEEREPLS
jgi:hypothetical protein